MAPNLGPTAFVFSLARYCWSTRCHRCTERSAALAPSEEAVARNGHEAGSLSSWRTQQSTNCMMLSFCLCRCGLPQLQISRETSLRETSLPSWASCGSKKPQPLLARSGLTCSEAGSLSCYRLPPCRNQRLSLHCAGRSSRRSRSSTACRARETLSSPRTSWLSGSHPSTALGASSSRASVP